MSIIQFTRSDIGMITGGVAFFLLVTKLTRNKIAESHGERRLTKDNKGVDLNKDLKSLNNLAVHGSEVSIRSNSRPDPLDTMGFLAAIPNTFIHPEEDILGRPSQYYTTGDTASVNGNPLFPM